MTSTRPAPTQLTARCPEDLLALVPLVLGFVPERSVAMLTFGAARAFHARVDLPDDPEEVPELVASLLEPALEHGVARVVFVLYACDAPGSAVVFAALLRAFTAAGVDVVEALRADGRRWFPMRPGHPEGRGVPYDVSTHRFTAQAVLDGRVTHRSREELAATLVGLPELVAPVAAALAAERHVERDAETEIAWAASTVRDHLAHDTGPGDAEVARLLVALRDDRVLDELSSQLTRADAAAHVAFWTAVLQRSPTELLAGPAGLVALAAWLAGHGALAWCAVDRCLAAEPEHPLAGCVAGLLTRALPPDLWDEGDGDPSWLTS